MMYRFSACLRAASALVLAALATPASAELVLSELIVDLQPGRQRSDDIEVWNDSPDRSFVAVEPREIENAGLPTQFDRRDPDPAKLALLVAPARMILEPGQRKLVRIAALPAGADRERVYRVTVKPVVGGLKEDASGLKIVLGYDVLVLVRPERPTAIVAGSRKGRALYFSNIGNSSVELVEGRQCQPTARCASLPGKRLYAGQSWTVELPGDGLAEYSVKSALGIERKTF